MKILIDCSSLQVGGGIQVAISFVNDLCVIENSMEIFILLSPQMKMSFDRNAFGENFKFIDFDVSKHSNIIKRILFLKKFEKQIQPSKIFSVFGPSYYKSNVPKVVGYALPHFIYEDSPYFQKLGLLEKARLFLMKVIKIHSFKQNSTKLIFETDDARNIFVKKYNFDKINTYVVNNTLNSIFINPEKWKSIKLEKANRLAILCLSANYPHKNLSIIPDVINYLVKCGFTNFFFYLSAQKEELGFDSYYDQYIKYIGKINIERVPLLYGEMDLFFMPTLLEVFSTSYLEAMHMKVPIVTTNLSFSKYICRDAAIYYEPTDPNDAAKQIIKVLSSEELSSKLILHGLQNLKRFSTSMNRTTEYLKIIEGM